MKKSLSLLLPLPKTFKKGVVCTVLALLAGALHEAPVSYLTAGDS